MRQQTDNPGRERILDAAEALFAEQGFDGTSIQQVARRSGISKATVFHHFDSKEDLYIEVVRRACDGTASLLEAFSADGNALEQLGEYRQRDMTETLAHASVVRLIMRELIMGDDDSRARQLVDRVFGEHYLRLRTLVERARESGQLRRDVDAGLQAASVVSINLFLFLVWPVLRHLPDTPFGDIEEAASRMYRMMLEGMMPAGECA